MRRQEREMRELQRISYTHRPLGRGIHRQRHALLQSVRQKIKTSEFEHSEVFL